MCSLFSTELQKLNAAHEERFKKVVISGTFSLLEKTEFNSLNLVESYILSRFYRLFGEVHFEDVTGSAHVVCSLFCAH